MKIQKPDGNPKEDSKFALRHDLFWTVLVNKDRKVQLKS